MIPESGIPKWKTEMRKLNGGSYAYIQAEGSWGLSNAGLIVGDNFSVAVDTLNSIPVVRAFFKEIKAVTDKEIKYIALTHHHPDHVCGSLLLPGATSICNINCYREMEEMSRLSKNQLPSGVQFNFTEAITALDYITFDNAATLHLGTREIQQFYYGFAHTVGDTVVYVPEDGVVFCGDLVFFYSTPMSIGGSFSGWIKALDKMLNLNASLYVPGHGPPCGREGAIKCRDYLTLVYEEAKKAFSAGLPYREAALRIALGEFKQWADPERVLGNVRCIYRELRNEGPAPASEAMDSIMEMRELEKTGW